MSFRTDVPTYLVHNDNDNSFVIVINGKRDYVPEYYPTLEKAAEAQEHAMKFPEVTSVDLFVRINRRV